MPLRLCHCSSMFSDFDNWLILCIERLTNNAFLFFKKEITWSTVNEDCFCVFGWIIFENVSAISSNPASMAFLWMILIIDWLFVLNVWLTVRATLRLLSRSNKVKDPLLSMNALDSIYRIIWESLAVSNSWTNCFWL